MCVIIHLSLEPKPITIVIKKYPLSLFTIEVVSINWGKSWVSDEGWDAYISSFEV